jgi:hypothetical protein
VWKFVVEKVGDFAIDCILGFGVINEVFKKKQKELCGVPFFCII